MDAKDVGDEPDVGAVVGLVVAFVAADVEIALVEAVDHLEAEDVLPARLSELPPELTDEVTRDLGRGGVPRRDDRRVRHEHEVLLRRRAPGVLDELLDLLAAHLALGAFLVTGVERIEEDDRLDPLRDRLAEDLGGGAVARAPGRQREVLHVRALLAAPLLHVLLDALEDAGKEGRVREARLVRARPEAEIDPHEDGAVARLDELFSDRLVTVEMHQEIEAAVGADAALVRGDHLPERDVLPLVVDAEARVRRHARVRAVAVLRGPRRRGIGRGGGVRLAELVVVRRRVALGRERIAERGQREQERGGADESGREASREGQLLPPKPSHGARETSSFLPRAA